MSDVMRLPTFLHWRAHEKRKVREFRRKDLIEEERLRHMEQVVQELEAQDDQEIKLRFMRALRDSFNDLD